MLKIIVRERVMDKEKKYFKELKKKVDIYFMTLWIEITFLMKPSD